MLPFDRRPWAKTVARTVILLSVLAAIASAYYLYDAGMLYIPETLIILLLLLTILPPNIAIIYRKDELGSGAKPPSPPRTLKPHTR